MTVWRRLLFGLCFWALILTAMLSGAFIAAEWMPVESMPPVALKEESNNTRGLYHFNRRGRLCAGPVERPEGWPHGQAIALVSYQDGWPPCE